MGTDLNKPLSPWRRVLQNWICIYGATGHLVIWNIVPETKFYSANQVDYSYYLGNNYA